MARLCTQPPPGATPPAGRRALTRSAGQDRQGHGQLRQAAQQEPHALRALRQALLAPAEEPVLVLRLPGGAAAVVQLGQEGDWPQDDVRGCCAARGGGLKPAPARLLTPRRPRSGTGRCRHLKTLPRRFKNGFREGARPRSRRVGLREPPCHARRRDGGWARGDAHAPPRRAAAPPGPVRRRRRAVAAASLAAAGTAAGRV